MRQVETVTRAVKATLLKRSAFAVAAALCASAGLAQTESKRLNAFFEEVHQAALKRWPQLQTNLGLKGDYDKWNDRSEAKRLAEHEITIRNLTRLQTQFDYERLDAPSKVSYRLFEKGALRNIQWFPFRHHYYPITQLGGMHRRIPTFLIRRHAVDTRADAEAYLARLAGISTVLQQVVDDLELRVSKGIIPPRFVFPGIYADIRSILSGAPFDDSGRDTALLADFREKVTALDLPENDTRILIEAARRTLRDVVQPAYRALEDYLRIMQRQATTDDGAWKLPDGDDYYAMALRSTTTTAHSAAQIHALGLNEVARIHAEMRDIVSALGFAGDLQGFFRFILTDDSNFYPDTDAGRTAYLEKSRALIDAMRAQLPTVFHTQPRAGLEVRRVESYREKAVDIGFYDAPAVYGERPGIYYVNLHDMRLMPKTHMEALAYHEAVPGHHMQIALAQQLPDLPKFRRFGGYAAYVEGWALYAERLAKEMGFYRDRRADFGRLAWELLRAARLVVDTGLHHKRWTREQAIAYLDANVAQAHEANRKAIDRYIVWPGQATAYTIGMQKILELRARARQALGSRFDVREFHHTVLSNGAVPLDVLESAVEAWLRE